MLSIGGMMKQIEELEKQLNDLEKESEMLKSYWTKSNAQLEALKQTDQISEVEYDTIKASLTTIVPENIKQADKIAKLEKEAGTKAYITLGGVIGFDNMSPQYGVTGSLGVRIGNSLMLEAGVEYMLGNLSDPFNINFTSFDLDDLRVTASIGWMF